VIGILQHKFDDESCFHSAQNLTKRIFLIKNRYFIFIEMLLNVLSLSYYQTDGLSGCRIICLTPLKTMFSCRNPQQDSSSNLCCKIPMWFTDAYIKNIFVKLIFKIFTLENSMLLNVLSLSYYQTDGLSGCRIICLTPLKTMFSCRKPQKSM
jgi:hypothetical protein